MISPIQDKPALETTVRATSQYGDAGFAGAGAVWNSLRSNQTISRLKQLRPLVALVRGFSYWGGLLLRPYWVARYFKRNKVAKLQIGADIWLLPGWLNSDLYPKALGCITLDATKPFPFQSGSFDYIFSEHQMEHIPYGDADKMLRECHRVLRPGGKLRIATPCLDHLLALFMGSQSEVQRQYIAIRTHECYPETQSPNPCFAMNAAFMNWGHRFLYNKETLSALLQEIGYSKISFFEVGQSDDPNLSGIEMRTSRIDLCETMVVEAERSGG